MAAASEAAAAPLAPEAAAEAATAAAPTWRDALCRLPDDALDLIGDYLHVLHAVDDRTYKITTKRNEGGEVTTESWQVQLRADGTFSYGYECARCHAAGEADRPGRGIPRCC